MCMNVRTYSIAPSYLFLNSGMRKIILILLNIRNIATFILIPMFYKAMTNNGFVLAG